MADAAEKLGVDRNTIYRWIQQRKIPLKYIKSFPNGMIAINTNGLIKPRRKKYTHKVNTND